MNDTTDRDPRQDLLDAIDATYAYGVLGYDSPEKLVAAFEATVPAAAAVPVPAADRATVLREAADRLASLRSCEECDPGRHDAIERLRVWAAAGRVAADECPQCGDTGACNGGPCPLTRVAAETCANCGKPVRRITGTLTAWWVHEPGGTTICHPQQAATSPRATPAGEAAPEPETQPCGCPPPQPGCRLDHPHPGYPCEPVHIGGRANAEDCPACADTNPPYPFICPGPAAPVQPGKEADNPRTVCVCGHTRGEHITVSGRLLCDACNPDSTDNLICKEFEAL